MVILGIIAKCGELNGVISDVRGDVRSVGLRTRGVDHPRVLHFFNLSFVKVHNTFFSQGEFMGLGKF